MTIIHKIAILLSVAFVVLVIGGVARANPRITCDNDGKCFSNYSVSYTSHSRRSSHKRYSYDGTIVGGRPPGCPYRFCGCEASLYVFGEIKKSLNRAWEWAVRFPRAHPAPGMAAVRRHHVMILMSHVEGSDWRVHDGNSGGGKTREHVRSIRGYVIVDPHGNKVAMSK